MTDRWPRGLYIYTPVHLTTSSVAFGAAADQVYFPGGSVGRNCMIFDHPDMPSVGQRVALFLGPALTAAGERDAAHLDAYAAWPVNSDGDVLTPADGKLTVAAFIATVQQVKATP